MIGIVEIVERIERASALLFVAAFEMDVVTIEKEGVLSNDYQDAIAL